MFPLVLRQGSVCCFEKIYAYLLTCTKMQIPAIRIGDPVIFHIIFILDYNRGIVHELTVLTDRGSVLESTAITIIDLICPSHLLASFHMCERRASKQPEERFTKETGLESFIKNPPFSFRALPSIGQAAIHFVFYGTNGARLFRMQVVTLQPELFNVRLVTISYLMWLLNRKSVVATRTHSLALSIKKRLCSRALFAQTTGPCKSLIICHFFSNYQLGF